MKTKIVMLLGIAAFLAFSAVRFVAREAEAEAEATASLPRKHCAVIGCAVK